MIFTSEDVLHSLFIPAFRVKADAIPGRYSSIWFTPTKTGEFHRWRWNAGHDRAAGATRRRAWR